MRLLPLLFAAVLGPLALTAGAVRAQPVEHPFTFSPLPHGLPGLVGGTLKWADVDGDADLDLLLTGLKLPLEPFEVASCQTLLLRNDGPRADPTAEGGRTFGLAPTTAALPGLCASDAAFADVDGDDDLDLVLTGSTTTAAPYTPAAFLFLNDGGTFRDASDRLNVPALVGARLAFTDADRDGDPDLIVSGSPSERPPFLPLTGLFRNDAGRFAPVPTALTPVAFGDLAAFDADGDGDDDVVLAGASATGLDAALYRNDGGPLVYTRVATRTGAVAASAAASAGAERLLALTGARPSPYLLVGTATVERVDASGFAPRATLDGRFGGSADWGDYDGDGDTDLALTGAPSGAEVAAFDVVRFDAGTPSLLGRLAGLAGSAAAWGDADGDGDLDLAATGFDVDATPRLLLYRNERFGLVAPPSVPDPVALLQPDGSWVLQWTPPAPGLAFDVWVGTAPGRADVVRPEARLANGYRPTAAAGPIGGRTYRLPPLAPGTYHFGVQAVSAERVGGPFATGTLTVAPTDVAPTEAVMFALDARSPSRPGAGVRVGLPAPGAIRLRLYDAVGRVVATLADGPRSAGWHTLALPTGLAPGLYVLDLHAGAGRRTASLVVLP